MPITIGSGGVNRNVSKITEGVGSVNKVMASVKVGNGGVNRQVFSNAINIDFSAKDASWSEVGGAFTYGSGLTSTTKGTGSPSAGGFTVTAWTNIKYLKIPIPSGANLTKFTLEFDNYMYSSSVGLLLNLLIGLCNGDNAPILTIQRVDAWADSVNQNLIFWKGRCDDGVISWQNTSASYNGVTFAHKIVFNAGAVSYYIDGALYGTATITSPLTIDNIKIGILNYSSYGIDTWKMNYLKFTY